MVYLRDETVDGSHGGPFATAGEPLVRIPHFSGLEVENPLQLLNPAIAFHEAGVRCGSPDKIGRRRVESDI
jgi:hypothetical protein